MCKHQKYLQKLQICSTQKIYIAHLETGTHRKIIFKFKSNRFNNLKEEFCIKIRLCQYWTSSILKYRKWQQFFTHLSLSTPFNPCLDRYQKKLVRLSDHKQKAQANIQLSLNFSEVRPLFSFYSLNYKCLLKLEIITLENKTMLSTHIFKLFSMVQTILTFIMNY